MIRTRALALLAALTGPGLGAQTTPPAAPASANDRLVNIPGTPWQLYGPGQTGKVDDKGGPQGYPLTQVTVTAVGKNPWDAGANAPLTKPIAAGDLVFVAAYLRAPKLPDGATVTLPVVVTGATPPYDLVATGAVAVGREWKQVYAVGKAPHAFAAGAAQVGVHLAGAKGVIDLGPARVFDFGPDADPARLPHN